MRMAMVFLAASAWMLMPAHAGAQQQQKDLVFFLNRLVDLDRLMILEPGVRCRQASSYDRASKYDPKTGKYINWAANGDCGKYQSVDPATGEGLIADIKGPGCIVRIWSANPQGVLRFYLDGDKNPTYEFDHKQLYTGKLAPFRKPIVWCRGEGGAASCSYFPIPFARRCRITAVVPGKKAPPNQYYHVGYQTFPADWKVKTFRLPLSAREKETLRRVCRLLQARGEDPQPPVGQGVRNFEGERTIAPGKSQLLLPPLKGPAAVCEFFARLDSGERWASRKVLLRFTWDGSARPQVEVPFGDFFGEPFRMSPYKSLPMGITDEFNYCYFRMPFKRTAKLEVVNQGRKPAKVSFRIVVRPVVWTTKTAYFHARWRRDANSSVFDYPFLECAGSAGRFVGVCLFVDNILGGWWGEGDEKVYVDGEKFPSTFGTGSEDYFGDAWGIRYFENPFHGFPQRQVRRQQSCYRWHISDDIPFARSFRMTIENYAAFSKAKQRNDYSSVAYWYQLPGGRDFFESAPVERRIPIGLVVRDAIEAERLLPAGRTQPGATVVDEEDLPQQLSAGKALRLVGPVGAQFVLHLPVELADRYGIKAFTAAGVSSCRYKLILAGQDATDNDRIPLTAGENESKVVLLGPAGEDGRCRLLLDYFLLFPFRNFVKQWYVLWPFDNAGDKGFETVFPPERRIDLKGVYRGKGGKQISWRLVKADEKGIVFLPPAEWVTAYAYCELESPRTQPATILLGSDDGVKLWLNGELVFQNHSFRGVQVDQDRVRVRLRRGLNSLLMKITQGGGPWGFTLRFADVREELKYRLPVRD